jgi:pimeloyl-ACP methyl ester carboxylesterase
MTRVRKGFVDLPHGQVHFRYGGRGPVVVLLHGSPRSSAQHAANIEWLGEHFTVIAPDTPGNGNSTALPQAAPEIPDFAGALADALTALGIERCGLYGYHSGAKIALRFAADHPDRAALAVLDGLALGGEPPSRRFLERYLPAFEPTADGTYLAQQWRRALDAHRYFPWFERTAGTRLRRALPDDAELHDYVTDLFMAGPHWTEAYGAALRHDAAPDLRRLRSAAVLLHRDDAVPGSSLEHLPQPLPAHCSVERVPPQLPAWRARLLEILRHAALPRGDWSPAPPRAAVGTRRSRQSYVDLVHGQLCVRLQGEAERAAPLLLLHDVPGGSCALRPLAEALAGDRRTITPDLPGLGESHPLPYPSLGSYVTSLAEMLEQLDTGPVDVFAEGLGTCFAVALAARHPALVRRLALDGLPLIRLREQRLYAKQYCPPLVPDRHGGHLLRAWGQLCDAESCWPWFDRSPAAARLRDPGLDPDVLHARLVDVMKQLPSYGDAASAALEARVRDILRGVHQPTLLFDVAEDVRYKGTQRAARRLADHLVVPRPATVAALAERLGEFLA